MRGGARRRDGAHRRTRLIAHSVVHCLRAPLGGLFRHVCDLATEQSAAGFRVGIICSSLPVGGHAEWALDALSAQCGLGVHTLPIHRRPGLDDRRQVRRAEAVCRSLGADLIHGHGAKGGAYARLLASRTGAAAIYTPHGGALHFDFRRPTGALYLGMERWLRGRTDGFVFESHFARRAYAAKVGSVEVPHTVAYNGVREDELQPLEAQPPADDFVFVGELRPIKGLAVLLDAVSLLRETHPNVRVRLVGGGRDAARLDRAIELRGLAGNVVAHGPVYPAREAFARARCVVLPSNAESFPYVALEAAAGGIPLIATRVGGLAEMFGPAASHLVRPGSATALRDALAHFLAAPEDFRQLANVIRERVRRRFVVATMTAEINALYGRVLGSVA